jgi:protein O-mannosyl-transferase
MTGSIEKLLAVFSRFNWLLQWLILSLLALLLYIPVIGNYFVNDDFVVLKKVCLEKELNTEGFFRPLSDISIYANYIFSGFNPLAYTITSIVIHAFNALLLFHFCLRWPFTEDIKLKRLFAGIAAVFFLTYPFHNEPVVWLLGRASLLASTFAFMALAIITGPWKEGWKMVAVAICYFIAMTGYESVLVLPAIIFIWMLSIGLPFKKIMIWMGLLALVLVAHFIIRIQVSGSAAGDYGSERLLVWNIGESVLRAFKGAGRMLVPPMKNAVAFSILAALSMLTILVAIAGVWKKSGEKKYTRVQLLAWLGMLLIAMIIPLVFSVSTNSSEGDRLLYFPSFFLCPLLAFLILHLPKNSSWPWLVMAVIAYNIIFLQRNNRNWQKASHAVSSLLNIVKDKPVGKTYIINMPDELDGAFVFRVGFRDALMVNGIDTASARVVNFAAMRELVKLPEINHSPLGNGLLIPPGVLIQRAGTAPAQNKYQQVFVSEADKIAYWNKERWVVLQGPALFK